MNEIRLYMNILKEAEERASLLNENMMDIDNDVDMIYDMYFKKYIDAFNRTGNVDSVSEYVSLQTDTSILNNEICKKAHELNPCTIYINDICRRNMSPYYKPSSSEISLILPFNAINYIRYEWSGVINDAATDYPQIPNELTEHKMKGTINHELIHWLDDTFNNNIISKKIDSYQKYEDLYNKGVNKTHMIFYEINAMMGNIKQAYNIHKNEWDNLTFDDLIKLIPSLSNAKSVMMGDELSKYYRKIKMRMFREGILGKKMR